MCWNVYAFFDFEAIYIKFVFYLTYHQVTIKRYKYGNWTQVLLIQYVQIEIGTQDWIWHTKASLHLLPNLFGYEKLTRHRPLVELPYFQEYLKNFRPKQFNSFKVLTEQYKVCICYHYISHHNFLNFWIITKKNKCIIMNVYYQYTLLSIYMFTNAHEYYYITIRNQKNYLHQEITRNRKINLIKILSRIKI